MTYATLDYLADLTNAEMQGAEKLSFFPLTNNPTVSSEAKVSGDDDIALLHSVYKFYAIGGEHYDFSSISYFDPYLLLVYDNLGNAIASNNDADDPEEVLFKRLTKS